MELVIYKNQAQKSRKYRTERVRSQWRNQCYDW